MAGGHPARLGTAVPARLGTPVPARLAMIASEPATSGRVPRFAVSARWRMWDSSRAMLPQMLLMIFGFAARFDSSSATIFFT